MDSSSPSQSSSVDPESGPHHLSQQQTPHKKNPKTLSKFFYFAIFLDILCVALVVPQMAHHMTILSSPPTPSAGGNNINNLVGGISNSSTSMTAAPSHSPALFGFIQATYGIMQMLSTPIMGALSDTLGKKKVLLMSVIGTSAAYGILVFALMERSMVLFFVSRALVGAIRQTVTVASAYVSEVYGKLPGGHEEEQSNVKKKSKTENLSIDSTTECENEEEEVAHTTASPALLAQVSAGMSYLHASASMGFMVGPLLGGYMAHHYGDLSPCIASCALDALNALAMYFMLPDTTPLPKTAPARQSGEGNTAQGENTTWTDEKKNQVNKRTNEKKKKKPNPIRFIIDILFGKSHTSARKLLVAMYLFSTANIALHSSLSAIGKEVFAATPLQIGAMMSLSSGVGAIFLIFIMPTFVKIFSNKFIVMATAIISFSLYFGQMMAPSLLFFTIFEVFGSVSNSVNGAANKARFSTMFPPERSGEAFAVIFSLDGINRVIMPITTGILMQLLSDRVRVHMTKVTAETSDDSDSSSESGFSVVSDGGNVRSAHPMPTPTATGAPPASSPSSVTLLISSLHETASQVSRPMMNVIADSLIRLVGTASRTVCASAEITNAVYDDYSVVSSSPSVRFGDDHDEKGEIHPVSTSTNQVISFVVDIVASTPLRMLAPSFWRTPADLTRSSPPPLHSASENGNAATQPLRKMNAFCEEFSAKSAATTISSSAFSASPASSSSIPNVGIHDMTTSSPPSDTILFDSSMMVERFISVFNRIMFWDDLDANVSPSSVSSDSSTLLLSSSYHIAEIALEQRQRASQVITVGLSLIALFAMVNAL